MECVAMYVHLINFGSSALDNTMYGCLLAILTADNIHLD